MTSSSSRTSSADGGSHWGTRARPVRVRHGVLDQEQGAPGRTAEQLADVVVPQLAAAAPAGRLLGRSRRRLEQVELLSSTWPLVAVFRALDRTHPGGRRTQLEAVGLQWTPRERLEPSGHIR